MVYLFLILSINFAKHPKIFHILKKSYIFLTLIYLASLRSTRAIRENIAQTAILLLSALHALTTMWCEQDGAIVIHLSIDAHSAFAIKTSTADCDRGRPPRSLELVHSIDE